MSRRPKAAPSWVLAAAAVVLAASCRKSELPVTSDDSGIKAAATAPRASPPTPASGSKPPAAATGTAAAAATAEALVPPRLGPPGSTRRTIACGNARCAADKETCVLIEGKWSCAASPVQVNTTRRLACDDQSDCTQLDPRDKRVTCCIEKGSRVNTVCEMRDAADTEPCSDEVCSTESGAALCPFGESCVEGFCRAKALGATCDLGVRCPADKPVCSYRQGAGTCVSKAEAKTLRDAIVAAPESTALASVLSCTQNDDCGKRQACCVDLARGSAASYGAVPFEATLPQIAECRRTCDHVVFDELCATDRDCPEFFVTGVNGGSKKQHCVARPKAPTHPGWFGHCELAASTP